MSYKCKCGGEYAFVGTITTYEKEKPKSRQSRFSCSLCGRVRVHRVPVAGYDTPKTDKARAFALVKFAAERMSINDCARIEARIVTLLRNERARARREEREKHADS